MVLWYSNADAKKTLSFLWGWLTKTLPYFLLFFLPGWSGRIDALAHATPESTLWTRQNQPKYWQLGGKTGCGFRGHPSSRRQIHLPRSSRWLSSKVLQFSSLSLLFPSVFCPGCFAIQIRRRYGAKPRTFSLEGDRSTFCAEENEPIRQRFCLGIFEYFNLPRSEEGNILLSERMSSGPSIIWLDQWKRNGGKSLGFMPV